MCFPYNLKSIIIFRRLKYVWEYQKKSKWLLKIVKHSFKKIGRFMIYIILYMPKLEIRLVDGGKISIDKFFF